MKVLDKSRPYGECFGDTTARYVQDGCEFDAKGRLLKSSLPPEEKSLEEQSWKELKRMMEERGMKYTNRSDAIAYLSEDMKAAPEVDLDEKIEVEELDAESIEIVGVNEKEDQ